MKHSVRLSGPGTKGMRISGPLLRDLLDILVEGSRKAVRLSIEGRSTARGTQPGWLDLAASFEMVGISPGSTCLAFEAHTLREVIPDHLAPEFDGARTSLQLFTESLKDAIAGKADSERYDESLIETLTHFGDLIDRGVEAIDFGDGEPLRISEEGVATIKGLRKQIPQSRYVRVAGELDAIRHSDRMFALVLDDGKTVRGVVPDQATPELLGSLFGKQAIVSGTAYFRPSGSLQRLEAQRIEAATSGEVALYSGVPSPLLLQESLPGIFQRQGTDSGIGAIFGKWPGDESDEEIEQVLKSLS